MVETLIFWSAACLAAFFVGASKGGLPMVAVLAVPIISLVMPPMQGAALLLPVFLVSDVFGLWIYRHVFSRRNLAILIPAGAAGVFLGWLFAGSVDDDMVRVIIGTIGLGFIAMRQWGRLRGRVAARPANVPSGLFWGTVAGFTSFVSHAGGPAFQVYILPQRLEKMVFAGTATILFALINLMKVPPYLALGLVAWADLQIVAILAPVAIIGAWVGYRLIQIIPERVFFIAVEVALFLVSLNLIRIGLAL